MFEFIFGLIVEAFFSPKSNLGENVEKLKQEEWFAALEEDFRYNYIIWNNRKVERYLASSTNLAMLLNDDQEQKKFTELIIQEHIKFTTSN
jgi:hypothetical protein